MKRKLVICMVIVSLLGLAVPTMAQEGISIGQAEAIIIQTYPDVTIVSIQRIQQNSRLVWEARLSDGTVIYVDAQTGEITGRMQASAVLSTNRASAQAAGSLVVTSGLPPIDFNQALSIAHAQYPGTSLIRAELEPREHTRGTGPLTWDMKMSNGMAVYVDATTGDVVGLAAWGGRRGLRATPMGDVSIALEEALSLAQEYYPGRNFVEIKLEYGGRREGYALVWKFEFGRGQEVAVDAVNGTVVRTR